MEGLFPMLNLIQLQMGDQKLGYTAFLGAFNFSNPLFKMTADAVAGKHKKMEPHEILEQSKNSFVVVKGSNRKSISYTFKGKTKSQGGYLAHIGRFRTHISSFLLLTKTMTRIEQ